MLVHFGNLRIQLRCVLHNLKKINSVLVRQAPEQNMDHIDGQFGVTSAELETDGARSQANARKWQRLMDPPCHASGVDFWILRSPQVSTGNVTGDVF